MGVHFQIYCSCGAFAQSSPVVSAACACATSRQRTLRSRTILQARLAGASLRAFDRDSGSFTLAVRPLDGDDEAEPFTVAFVPSDQLADNPLGIAALEAFIRTARQGTPISFAGRWVTRSWPSRNGALVESREFEATRFAEGVHGPETLLGPNADGAFACPSLAARALVETLLPAHAKPAPANPADLASTIMIRPVASQPMIRRPVVNRLVHFEPPEPAPAHLVPCPHGDSRSAGPCQESADCRT